MARGMTKTNIEAGQGSGIMITFMGRRNFLFCLAVKLCQFSLLENISENNNFS